MKDKDLQQAYGCTAPSVSIIFKTGEITPIAAAILRCAGFGKSIETKIHEEKKNLFKTTGWEQQRRILQFEE